jgi:hypothetical protein
MGGQGWEISIQRVCMNLNAAEALTQRRKAAEAQGFKSI